LVFKRLKSLARLGHLPKYYDDRGAFSGLRRGELLALHFGDVDWPNKEILVTKALTRGAAKDGVHRWKWEIGPTKTKRSIRRVVISDDILLYLARMKKTTTNPNRFLFPDKNGNPIDPDYFDSLFAEIKKRAGQPEIRFHDLRHFFASLLISQGFSPKYVCDQLGHSSIQVTFDTYGHLFPQGEGRSLSKARRGN